MKLKIRRLGGLPGPLFTGSCSASGFDVCGGLCTVSFSRTISSLLSGSLTRVSSGKHNGRLSGTDFSGCGWAGLTLPYLVGMCTGMLKVVTG